MNVKEVKVEYSKTVSKNYNSQKIGIGVDCSIEEGEDYGNIMTTMFLYCKTKVQAFEQSLQQIVIEEVIREDEKPEVEKKGIKNDLPNELVGVVVTEVRPKAIRIEVNGRSTWLPIKALVKGFESHDKPQTVEVMDWMKEKIEWRDL